MIQLFVSDMDGTLLDKHAQISPRTVAAIHRAQAAGVMFAVATGRSFAEATNVLHAHHIHCPLIAVNGAAVYDEHQQLVSQSPLPRDVALSIIETVAHPELMVEVITPNTIFAFDDAPRKTIFLEHINALRPNMSEPERQKVLQNFFKHLPLTVEPQLLHLLKSQPDIPILKLLCAGGAAQAPLITAIYDRYRNHTDLTVTSSAHHNVEINSSTANKGVAVAALAAQHQIPLSKVAAIGDNFNDLSMLQKVGYSFAMDNAPDAVKQAAHFQTASFMDDGVALALESLLDGRIDFNRPQLC